MSTYLPTLGAILTALVVLSACSPHRGIKDQLTFAAVPEADRRLSFDVAHEGPQVLERALEQAVCLVLSSQFGECRVAPQEPDVCTERTRAAVDSALRPIFTVLRDTITDLRLTSPSLVKAGLEKRLPNTIVTDEVYDARRTAHCRDWAAADGACLAIRTDSLWILLRGSPAPEGKVQTVEVYLTAPSTCGERPHP